MKYMKTELKEEIYNKGKRDIEFIESVLRDNRMGDSNNANEYKQMLEEWKQKMVNITVRLCDEVHPIIY